MKMLDYYLTLMGPNPTVHLTYGLVAFAVAMVVVVIVAAVMS